MNHKTTNLAAGLYLVATPLGSARDITLRGLDILVSADVLAAEDTRTARKLLEIHAIPLNGRRIIAYHDHSHAGDRAKVLDHIRNGRSVAYVSEAGTPLIADPGFQLVSGAREAGLDVTTAPGPAACIAALTLCGLPTDRFYFAGFLPSQGAARKTQLAELLATPATLVLYESPKRVQALLDDVVGIVDADRRIALCRELTKKFEEVFVAPIGEAIDHIIAHPPRGEYVVVVEPGTDVGVDQSTLEDAIRKALLTMRVKDAADSVAGAYNQPRRDIYQLALKMKAGGKG